MSRTTRTTLLVTTALLLSSAAWSQSSRPYNDRPSSLRFSYGEFKPDGQSVYWQTREADFFGSVRDFEDDRFGVTYSRTSNERWGYLFNAHVWDGRQDTSFRDFVDAQGNDIFHTATLEVFDFGAGVVFYPLRRNAIVAPYVAAGISVHAYDLTESGEFIDFESAGLEIFDGTFTDSGETLGWFWTLGLEIPLGSSFAVFGEYNWSSAEADLETDFAGFGQIDLGGEELAMGLSFRF